MYCAVVIVISLVRLLVSVDLSMDEKWVGGLSALYCHCLQMPLAESYTC